jgi:hypothetical protein
MVAKRLAENASKRTHSHCCCDDHCGGTAAKRSKQLVSPTAPPAPSGLGVEPVFPPEMAAMMQQLIAMRRLQVLSSMQGLLNPELWMGMNPVPVMNSPMVTPAASMASQLGQSQLQLPPHMIQSLTASGGTTAS